MTCIVAIEHNGRVWMGGDSAVTDDEYNSIQIIDQPKVWVRGGIAWGGAGDGRFIELVQHALRIPRLQAKHAATLDKWVSVTLGNALRECWRADMDLRPPDDRWPEVSLLVGVRGRLYEVGGDLSTVHAACGYTATGSGAYIALGVLRATHERRQPKPRITQALNAAVEMTALVRPPFHYVSA